MLQCRLQLPSWWHPAPFLAFHGRDVTSCSEKTSAHALQKALILDDSPLLLTFTFETGEVIVSMEGDDHLGTAWLGSLASRMLGLCQEAEIFHAQYIGHPEIGRLLQQHPPLYLPQTATPFEAISWAITGQQISLAAATTLRRRLISACNLQGPQGFLCYPDATALIDLGHEALRKSGFPESKALALLAVSHLFAENRPAKDPFIHGDAQAITTQLQTIRGIGPWTVNYAMLRGCGNMDVSLHLDNGVQRGLQNLLSFAGLPNTSYTRQWLAQFSPRRGLVAAYLWALPAYLHYNHE